MIAEKKKLFAGTDVAIETASCKTLEVPLTAIVSIRQIVRFGALTAHFHQFPEFHHGLYFRLQVAFLRLENGEEICCRNDCGVSDQGRAKDGDAAWRSFYMNAIVRCPRNELDELSATNRAGDWFWFN